MIRLRENLVWGPENSTVLNEQQIEQLHIKSKLQESQMSLDDVLNVGNELKEKLNESEKSILDQILARLKETGVKKESKVWRLPIGKYGNLNGNKRIYPKKLWENVKLKQADTWKGFCGLADHPEADNDPGEFKNQAVIWHDMEVGDNNTVYGFCSFVGPYGHLAQEILENNGRVGTSSSGFGDVDPITKTVDPDSYIIERLADLVLNPSQGTFGSADCPHTADEFMKDVHGAATIEFDKQQVREAQPVQNKARSKIMADNSQKFDAVAQAKAPQAKPAQPGSAEGLAGNEQNQPTNNQQLTESKMEQKGTLTKVEEKAFRKYVQTFIEDANKIDNPIKRLNECMDILNCFDEGNCVDLRESLEKQLLEEKANLEKLVETVISTEKDYNMNLSQFRESAERNTAQGLLLKEQITDYKELCDGLAKRNQQLKEENTRFQKLLQIKDKLSEKKIYKSNLEIVSKGSELDQLTEKVARLTEKNEHLIERVSKLALSNKQFEKDNDKLQNKLHEAVEIMMGVKKNNSVSLKEKTEFNSEISKLKETINEQDSLIKELENNYSAQSKRFDKLTESFDAYKQEVADTYNPVAHLMPKFEERVGKYLNLRENKGVEVETYWNDMMNKYGENIKPFEDKIRGAKTLKEATSNFLKYRTQIDPDFAVAQPAEYAYRNRSERAVLYESQGIVNPVDSYVNSSLEQKNEQFLKSLQEQGLQ